MSVKRGLVFIVAVALTFAAVWAVKEIGKARHAPKAPTELKFAP